jgi:hypothetical protein
MFYYCCPRQLGSKLKKNLLQKIHMYERTDELNRKVIVSTTRHGGWRGMAMECYAAILGWLLTATQPKNQHHLSFLFEGAWLVDECRCSLPKRYCPVRWIRSKLGLIRKACIKERGTEVFRKIHLPPSCESPLKIPRPLVQLLAIQKKIANGAHSSVRGFLFTA